MFKFWRLAYQIGKRNLYVHHAGASLGILWHFNRPFLTILVFAVVFSRAFHGEGSVLQYGVFLAAGLLPWQFFAQTISQATTSFTTHGRIILSRRLPLLAIPAGMALLQTLMLGAGGAVLVAAGWLLGLSARPSWALLPAVILVQQALALGLGLICSAVHVFVRDIGPTVDFILRLAFWLTPIAYRRQRLGGAAEEIVAWNPYTPVAEAFQGALLGEPTAGRALLAAAAAASGALLLGLLVYARARKRIPDMVG